MNPAPVGQQAGKTPDNSNISRAADNAFGVDLLADILASFASPESHARAKKEKTQTKKSTKAPAILGVGAQFNYKKTGYIVWKAIGRVARFQTQICACGAQHVAHVGELYELSNGTSHSVWQRPEGYDIEAPANLPIRAEMLAETRPISICPECAVFGDDPITAVLNTHVSPQLELSL